MRSVRLVKSPFARQIVDNGNLTIYTNNFNTIVLPKTDKLIIFNNGTNYNNEFYKKLIAPKLELTGFTNVELSYNYDELILNKCQFEQKDINVRIGELTVVNCSSNLLNISKIRSNSLKLHYNKTKYHHDYNFHTISLELFGNNLTIENGINLGGINNLKKLTVKNNKFIITELKDLMGNLDTFTFTIDV